MGSRSRHRANPAHPPVRRTLVAAGAGLLLVACGAGPATAPRVPTTQPVIVTTTTTTPVVVYRVQRGDSLTSIARRFGVSIDAITAANHIANVDTIAAGQGLVIPPRPPVAFVVTPARAELFSAFRFQVTGARPGEAIVFRITLPGGRVFTGHTHVADKDGSVAAAFLTTQDDPPGTYTVAATGDSGTSAHATFDVDAPGPVPGPVAGSTTTTSA